MVNWRKALGVTIAVALVSSMGLAAQKKDDKKDDKKRSDAQRAEVLALAKAVEDVAAGQVVSNDFDLVWVRQDFMKAVASKQFVPFIVSIDPTKTNGGELSFYWRVVSKNPTLALPEPEPKKDDAAKDKDQKPLPPKRPDYAWESVSFSVKTSGQKAPMRISRYFTVPAGPYDVYVAVKETASEKPEKSKKEPAAPSKMAALKQTITVPDFWNSELTTSSIVLAQKIDPLPAPLTELQQLERPYALTELEITPAGDTKLKKQDELLPFFFIYNPKLDSSNKPDIVVNYNFYVKSGSTEKFFNKTAPLNWNAQTLPPNFDAAAGHQLQGSQGVPLASFPEGEYRLEIKVTDRIANKSLTRDVNFTVVGS